MRAHTRRLLATAAALGTVLAASLPATAAPTGGALPPQLTLELQIAGVGDVPVDAVGVALNVTVTNPLAAGFLTVYPCGDRPLASNLNYVADQTVPNFVVAALDEYGAVCIDTMSVTDVVVDLAGYIPPGSPMVPLAAPQRFLDTRSGLGAPAARVAGGAVLSVSVAGGFGVPADAASVIFNVTAVNPSAAGFLTVFPCGQSTPETSTLNFAAGAIVPNLVVSAVGASGTVCVFSNVESDVIADVAAYATRNGDGLTTLERPVRLVDTRIGLGSPAEQIDLVNRVVAVGGRVGVPIDATAVIANLTATDANDAGFAAGFPCGGAVPLVSNLNFTAGANIANLSIIKLADDGTLCLRANRPVDVVIDVLGYTQDTAAFVPLPPSRLYDSREGADPPCNTAVVRDGSVFSRYQLGVNVPQSFPAQPSYNPPVSAVALVGPTCVVSLVGVVDNWYRVDEYTASGTPIRHYAPNNGSFSISVRPSTLIATADGLIGISEATTNNPASVVDFESGQTIFTPPLGWSLLSVSSDGSLYAFTRPTSGAYEVGYFTDTGVQILSTVLPPAAFAMDMSPNADYLSYRTGGGGLSAQSLVVATLDGTVVSSLPNGGDPTWFMNDGSIAVCTRPFGSGAAEMMRWDLFSDPRPLVSSNMSCASVVAAR